MKKQFSLIEAQTILDIIHEGDITEVKYEDGSLVKFIYKEDGENRYINLTPLTNIIPTKF